MTVESGRLKRLTNNFLIWYPHWKTDNFIWNQENLFHEESKMQNGRKIES